MEKLSDRKGSVFKGNVDRSHMLGLQSPQDEVLIRIVCRGAPEQAMWSPANPALNLPVLRHLPPHCCRCCLLAAHPDARCLRCISSNPQ